MARVQSKRGHMIGGGVIAGVVGGVVIAVFMLIANIYAGRDVWSTMKMAGAPFLGEQAMQPGFALVPVLVGVASHVAVSIAWGLVFSIVFYGLSKGATLVAGAMYGVIVWLLMFYVLLPMLGLGEITRSASIGTAVVEHVAFGVGVAIGFLPYQRRREHGVATPRPSLPST